MMPQVLNKCFEPIAVELFRLLLKPLSIATSTSSSTSNEFLCDTSSELHTTRTQMTPHLGCVEGVEQLQTSHFYCLWSGITSVAFHVILLKKHWLFPLINATGSLFSLTNATRSMFQSPYSFQASLRVDLHTFNHTLLVNYASVVPENRINFPVEGRIMNFFLLEKWSDYIHVTGFSYLCHTDTPNSRHVTEMYRKSLPSLSQWASNCWQLTCFQSCPCYFGCNQSGTHSAHSFCNPNLQESQWHLLYIWLMSLLCLSKKSVSFLASVRRFCLFKSWAGVTGLPDRFLVQVQISAAVPGHCTKQCTWILIGV